MIHIYWSEYGGIRELASSPFVHFSALCTFLYWTGSINLNWRNLALQALPTILGFSIAAYAITFSLMGSALHRALSSKIDKTRGIPLISIVNSTFFHVVICQVISLLFAILSEGSLFPQLWRMSPLKTEISTKMVDFSKSFGDLFGFFFTIYSVVLLLSVSLAMFRLGRMAPRHENCQATPPKSANDDVDNLNSVKKSVIETRRFKFVAWLSRKLNLYD